MQEKTIVIKGTRGAQGVAADTDSTAPLGAMLIIDDDTEIPAGFEEVDL